MIVPSMTNKERHEALYSDLETLWNRANKLSAKKQKLFEKKNRFPSYLYEEYEHHISKNKYLFIFYAESASMAKNPNIIILSFMQAGDERLVIRFSTLYDYLEGTGHAYATRCIEYYAGHFFSRYRERILKQDKISFNDVIAQYFIRNRSFTPLELNEDIKKEFLKYGDHSAYAYKVRDGICFIKSGTEGDFSTICNRDSDFIRVTLYNTIVSESMLTKVQVDAIYNESNRFALDQYRTHRKICSQLPESNG